MIIIKLFKYFSLCLILLLCVSCDTLLKTPSKSTAHHPRGTTVRQRSTPANTARNQRTSAYNTSRGRTSTAGTRTGTSASRTNTSRSVAANTNAPAVVQIARTYSGTPYLFGGNDKAGIDCSGLICSVYSEAGLKVPRISWQQSEFGREIENIHEIKPGDWVFFVPEAGKEGYVSHSGIVTEIRGSNEIIFIHASTSKGVREDNLYSTYFKNRFVKAMRPF